MTNVYETAINTGELTACINAVVDHYNKSAFIDTTDLDKQLHSDFKNYDKFQRIERVKVMCSM